MPTRLQLNLQRYSKFLSREPPIGREADCRSENVGVDIDTVPASSIGKMPEYDRRRRRTQLIVGQEELVLNRAIRSNKIIPRPWHPVHEGVIGRHVGIEDAEGANDVAAYI